MITVLPPYDQNNCVDCAVGGKCNGSKLVGNVEGSVWIQQGQYMRILECPAGYILVR